MAAITWRNIGAPNFSASNRLAESAGNQLQKSVSNLAGGINAYAKRDAASNDEAIAGFLSGIKTEDDYSAALNSGALSAEGLTERFGSNFNKGTARSAVEGLLGKVRQNADREFNRNQTLGVQNDTPLNQQFNSAVLSANGDINALKQLKESVGGIGFTNSNPALSKINAAIARSESKALDRKDRARSDRVNAIRDTNLRTRDQRIAEAARISDMEQSAQYFKNNNEVAPPVNPVEDASNKADLVFRLGEAGEGLYGSEAGVVESIEEFEKGGGFTAKGGRKYRIPTEVYDQAFKKVKSDQSFPNALDASKDDITKEVKRLMKIRVKQLSNNDALLSFDRSIRNARAVAK